MIYNRKSRKTWLCVAGLLVATQSAWAQSSVLNTNLIVNGNAEAGPASPDGKVIVASIPGWTRGTGTASGNVLPYGLTGDILLSDPAPPDHGFNYFTGNSSNSTLTQTIDVSSAASIIMGGNVKYTASAYLGSSRYGGVGSHVVMAFQNANGQTLNNATLGPLSYPGSGLTLQQQIGLVPSGTQSVMVTLTLTTSVYSRMSATPIIHATSSPRTT